MTFEHIHAAPDAPHGFTPSDVRQGLIESPRPCVSVGFARAAAPHIRQNLLAFRFVNAGLGSSLDLPYAGNSDPDETVVSGLESY